MQVTSLDLSYIECEIAIRILDLRNEPNRSIARLAQRIQFSSNSPTFRHVLRKLRNAGAIDITEIVGSMKLIHINHKALFNVLEEVPKMQRFKAYFEKHHLLIS